MSKEIDLSERLSDEDRQYLLQRNRLQDVIDNDAKFGGDEYRDPANEVNPSPETPRSTDLTPGQTDATNPYGLSAPAGQQSGDENDNDSDDGSLPDIDWETVTVEELKKHLDEDFEEPVPYKANDRRDDLVSVLKQARGES